MSERQAQQTSRFEKGWRRGGCLPGRLAWWLALAAVTGGVAAAGAQTAVSPTASELLSAAGLPPGAQEIVDQRTETAKYFQLPDGASTGIFFTRPIHYQDAAGQWQDIDLSFHDDGAGGQVADHNRAIVRVPAQLPFVEVTDTDGNGVRWLTSGVPTVNPQQANYRDAQGVVWTYTPTWNGVKHQGIVTDSRGPRRYAFAYQLLGNEPDFIIDADGNAVAGSLLVPRATVTDGNGVQYTAGP